MSYNEQSDKLAGTIGLLKQCVHHRPIDIEAPRSPSIDRVGVCTHRFVTRTGRETAEDATQVFGGRALTVSGMGKFIENVRTVLTTSLVVVLYLSQTNRDARSVVSSHVALRCHPWRCRGCIRRPGGPTGYEEDAEERPVVREAVGYVVCEERCLAWLAYEFNWCTLHRFCELFFEEEWTMAVWLVAY